MISFKVFVIGSAPAVCLLHFDTGGWKTDPKLLLPLSGGSVRFDETEE